MRFIFTFSLFLVIFSQWGCSLNMTGGGGTTSATEDGTWEECVAFGSGSIKLNLLVSGSHFTSTYTVYRGDTTCITPDFQTITTFTFVTGAEIPSITPGTAKTLDLTVVSATATPLSAAMVSEWNSTSECGKTDWVLNTAFSLIAATCGGGGAEIEASDAPTAVGVVWYDLYSIDSTTTPHRWYIADSDTGDGLTEANRPTAILTSFYLEKQ